ncbi:hypothetical protein [Lignipirellula cremea]|uniref:hypothetical protein n=1 Tax=Lignipirellula cremea TaxID=2528010 RepID=UPI00119ED435|nr:hypothetical protein [Lignipirellula cremea]
MSASGPTTVPVEPPAREAAPTTSGGQFSASVATVSPAAPEPPPVAPRAPEAAPTTSGGSFAGTPASSPPLPPVSLNEPSVASAPIAPVAATPSIAAPNVAAPNVATPGLAAPNLPAADTNVAVKPSLPTESSVVLAPPAAVESSPETSPSDALVLQSEISESNFAEIAAANTAPEPPGGAIVSSEMEKVAAELVLPTIEAPALPEIEDVAINFAPLPAPDLSYAIDGSTAAPPATGGVPRLAAAAAEDRTLSPRRADLDLRAVVGARLGPLALSRRQCEPAMEPGLNDTAALGALAFDGRGSRLAWQLSGLSGAVETPALKMPATPLTMEALGICPAAIRPLVGARYAATEPPSLTPEVAPMQPEVEGSQAPLSLATPERSQPAGSTPGLEETPSLLSERKPEGQLDRSSPWPYPRALIDAAARLEQQEQTRDLGQRLHLELEKLAGLQSFDDDHAFGIGTRLYAISQEAWSLAARVPENAIKVDLQRLSYSLARRVETWLQVHRIAAQGFQVSRVSLEPEVLKQRLADVDRQIGRLKLAASWRRYLLLDELDKLALGSGVGVEPADLARSVISRIESSKLTREQEEFFSQPEFVALKYELSRWSIEPVDYSELLRTLEAYEDDNLTADARPLAESIMSLRWSSGDEVKTLGQRLETRYRNANVRVSASAELLNRFIPDPPTSTEPVYDDIQGAYVQGRSQTEAQIQVLCLPDTEKIRLALQAIGVVNSQTRAYRKPVTFFNRGVANYQAQKLVTIDRDGMHVWQAQADAQSRVNTFGMATDLDNVPLVNSLVRNYADQQRRSTAGAARREVEAKIENRVRREFDNEIRDRLIQGEQVWREKVLAPLYKLRLDPFPVDMQTTESQLAIRYRLGNLHQLGAHTPRPHEPTNCLASVQAHQSTFNNFVEQLQLDDKFFTLPDLCAELTRRIDGLPPIPTDELPDDVVLQFAESDAVRVLFEQDHVEMRLRLAMLSSGRRTWRNIEIRARYSPVVNGRTLDFERQDHIELIGRLGFRDQIALRGIFSRVFSKNQVLPIIKPEMVAGKPWQGTRISQLVIDDGWIGLAFGHDHEAPVAPLPAESDRPLPPQTARRPQHANFR